MLRLMIALVLILVAGLLLLGSDPVSSAQVSSDTADTHGEANSSGRIVFRSRRDGDGALFIMNADGTGIRRLSPDNAEDTAPSWSPDGRRIAFHSRREGVDEIWVINIDGTDLTRLTHNEAQLTESWPDWSPDGYQIVFAARDRSGAGYNDSEIYVMDSDGSDVTQLTDNSTPDEYPAWSPDGTKIAFTCYRGDNDEICTINPDGTGVEPLTDDPGDDMTPAWSSDGSRIAFASDRSGDNQIHVMDANGENVSQVTSGPGRAYSPSWSPDGGQISYHALFDDEPYSPDVYVINADGSDPIRLTDGGPTDWAWPLRVTADEFVYLPLVTN